MHRSYPSAGVVFAALLLAACGGTTTVDTRGQPAARETTSSPGPSAEGPGRTAVGDADGHIRGTYLDDEDDARMDQVRQLVIKEGWADGPNKDPEGRSRLFDALLVLHPVKVIDERGHHVGYLTTEWVALDDYPAARAEAAAFVDSYAPPTED